MSNWVKTDSIEYVNLDSAVRLIPVQIPAGSGAWRIRASNMQLTGSVTLSGGPYSSASDTSEAIRKLVHGVDPSTIV